MATQRIESGQIQLRSAGAVPMVQGQTGTPMTYAMGGWQYIVLCIGQSADRGSEMIAYRLRAV